MICVRAGDPGVTGNTFTMCRFDQAFHVRSEYATCLQRLQTNGTVITNDCNGRYENIIDQTPVSNPINTDPLFLLLLPFDLSSFNNHSDGMSSSSSNFRPTCFILFFCSSSQTPTSKGGFQSLLSLTLDSSLRFGDKNARTLFIC